MRMYVGSEAIILAGGSLNDRVERSARPVDA